MPMLRSRGPLRLRQLMPVARWKCLQRSTGTSAMREEPDIRSQESDGTGFALSGNGPKQRGRVRGFTLAELLVTVGILVMLVLLFTQLLNSAATITTLGHKQMDADSQARQLLDRMAVDFAQMVKRADIDYYLKSAQTAVPDCTTCTSQTGNDRIAFFSTTTGYYPTPSYRSPVSLIAYRVNSDASSTNPARSYNKLERMGKGFVWNGVSASYSPIVFLDSATPPQNTIANKWPAAVSASLADPDGDYELIGPQVFRFEYCYQLKGASDPTGGSPHNS